MQLLHFFFAERLGLAEHVSYERDLGEVLHRFHLHERALKRRTISHHAMVRHQDRVMMGNQRFERVRQLRSARRPIARQRNRSEPNHHLAHQRAAQAQP